MKTKCDYTVNYLMQNNVSEQTKIYDKTLIVIEIFN